MAMTDSQLITQADVIKNETAQGANTALRVGTMLDDIISNKINNDKIDTDGTFAANSDTVVPSQKATKTYVGSQVTTLTAALALKEDTANKSNGPLGSSITLFPTENSVKTYVDTQDALDEKIANKVTTSAQVISNGTSVIKYPAVKAIKDYVDGVATGLLRDNGNYDPTISGEYPTSANTLSGGPVQVGDLWYIDTAGTMNGNAVLVGYSVRALINGADPVTDADWAIANVGLGFVPENSANKSDDGTFNSGSPSHVQFPTQFAVATYLANNNPLQDLYSVLTTGHNLPGGNNFQGTSAGLGNLGADVTGLGQGAAAGNTANNVNAFGNTSADSNTGFNVNAIGPSTAYHNTGSDVNSFGIFSAYQNAGSHLNAFGNNAAVNNSGDRVNAFGQNAGLNNTFNNVNLFGPGATADADNQLVIVSGTGANARISSTNVTADRKYELPDNSGTIALLSDIGSGLQTISVDLDQSTIQAGGNIQIVPAPGAGSVIQLVTASSTLISTSPLTSISTNYIYLFYGITGYWAAQMYGLVNYGSWFALGYIGYTGAPITNFENQPINLQLPPGSSGGSNILRISVTYKILNVA